MAYSYVQSSVRFGRPLTFNDRGLRHSVTPATSGTLIGCVMVAG